MPMLLRQHGLLLAQPLLVLPQQPLDLRFHALHPPAIVLRLSSGLGSMVAVTAPVSHRMREGA